MGGWLWHSVSSVFPNLGAHRAELCGRPCSGPLATVSSQLCCLHLNVRWQRLPSLEVDPWDIWEMMGEQNPFHGPLGSAKKPWEPNCCHLSGWQLLVLHSLPVLCEIPTGWSRTQGSGLGGEGVHLWGVQMPALVLSCAITRWAGGLSGLSGLAALQEGCGLAPLPKHLHGVVRHCSHLWPH